MAGSSDCIMSLSMWQTLIARITPNTVASAGFKALGAEGLGAAVSVILAPVGLCGLAGPR
jgi:hypothetical protein